jgi:hypothetical protein
MTKSRRACEKAVELAPTDGGIADSRGLARALTGDIENAIKDFRFFIGQGVGRNFELREQWIVELEAGNNPFTEKVLEQLRSE